jgi:hypothetical protein
LPNGCSEIYRTLKESPQDVSLFATYPARLEDLECDDRTFRSLGTAAIWSKDAYDGILNAFELNLGDCGFGGQPSHLRDSDGDGLPNVWETEGVHGAGDEFIDLPALGADPRHKDIFLWIDAEDGAQLSGQARRILVNAFARAPVSNPDGRSGIRLKVVRRSNLSASESDELKIYKPGTNTVLKPDSAKSSTDSPMSRRLQPLSTIMRYLSTGRLGG